MPAGARGSGGRQLATLLLVVVVAFGGGRGVLAEALPPLSAPDFVRSGEQGFGDRQNSWAWAMQWWRGRLYVGTNRAYRCVSAWELHRQLPALFPYPPADPDLDCATNPASLPLQAEIWRWTPETGLWERIYQSPADVPNPDIPGAFVPRDNGYRTMAVHTDPDGTEALYVGGISTKPMWAGSVPPPRILRSTDGATFQPIPQNPGTFMGSLPKASFRSLTSYKGQLFVIHGSVQGNGVVLASPNPAAGDDAWRQVTPEPYRFFELVVFNGWLYLGALDLEGGYAVYKTNATGEPPYTLIPVVQRGGYLSPRPSGAVVSMHVFNGRLYVGTDSPVELIRINPDDTWELVVGTPRQTPFGFLTPLSGLDDGFNNQFNDHLWRMQAHEGRLYLGTYDASILWKDDPQLNPRLQHLQGFDLYRTDEGWYISPITTNGFGDRFHFGVRNLASTPFGLFLGTANDYYGLQIWRGITPTTPRTPPAPARLEIERRESQPLLSWEPVPGAIRYHVQRAVIKTVEVTPPILPSGQSLAARAQILGQQYEGAVIEPNARAVGRQGFLQQTVEYPTTFVEIAVTRDTVFIDQTAQSATKYLYVALAEDSQGRLSASSNLVLSPALAPPQTLGGVSAMVDQLEQRGRLVPGGGPVLRQGLQRARDRLVAGDLARAFDQLQTLQQQVAAGGVVLSPEAADVQVVLGKLLRRVKLAKNGLVDPATLL